MWIGEELTNTEALSKDLIKAAKTMSSREIRFIVNAFYQMQDNRIRAKSQLKALTDRNEPHEVVDWLVKNNSTLEKQLQKAMAAWVAASPVGQWMTGIHGIGPVLAAGFMCYFDITKAPSVGHFHSLAGLVPGQVWKKGEKRPWNAELKRLCWMAGECFVKVNWKEDSFYGKEYLRRKQVLIQKNEAGEYADAAAEMLRKVPNHKQAKVYEKGILPDSHIHERAKRSTVKLFLSHLHCVMYRDKYKKDPPQPYAIAHQDHVDYIEVPSS